MSKRRKPGAPAAPARPPVTNSPAPRAAAARPAGGRARPATASTSAAPAGTLAQWLLPLLLIAVTWAAFRNGFDGAFLFDDKLGIVENPRIRAWPPWEAMANTSRPLVLLSLAVNYAVGGLDLRGYHAFNLAVHVGAVLALFGIARRMLASDPLRPRFGAAAPWLAGAIALVWAVHPLQTGAVTYVIQRAESMMGLFFLLTLYFAIRGAASAHPWRWYGASVAACALGMGSKEVMVVAPVVVLLYDRLFLASGFGEIWRRRGALYAGLAATWLLLGALLASSTGTPAEQLMLVGDITPALYALTQAEVIVHYLRLALWPSPLVFDYAWPLVPGIAAALPWVAVIAALLAATALALYRRHWSGFWGAWFFLILAPTSSVVVIADIAFEHRMYLPLAAVVVLVVVGVHSALTWAWRRLATPSAAQWALEGGLLAVVVVALAVATIARNNDYRSELAMWSDVVAKRPANARAQNNLGNLLNEQGRSSEAIPHLTEALRLKPDFDLAAANLGLALAKEGRTAEAIALYNTVLQRKPGYVPALRGLGSALAAEGRREEAIAAYTEALRLKPNDAETERNLGAMLFQQGRTKEAIAHLNRALQLNPGDAAAHNNLGAVLGSEGRTDEAIEEFAKAVRLKPDYAEARANLRMAQEARQQGAPGTAPRR